MQEVGKPLTIKEWALDDRPREKMISKGVASLSDAELMAILIGSGTRNETAVAIAQRILSSANNNLNELGKFSLKDFTKTKGIGQAKGVTIMAALELGRRRKVSEAINRKQITSSNDVIELFQPLLADLAHEEFWVLLLNRANRIIERVRISEGGFTATVVDVRKIMRTALDHQAIGIVLCHNHPSGNNHPSDDDQKITQKIKQAATTMDISLLDHVIITNQKCFSFADNNML
ncbi:MAG: DNA repair protein RadC [Tenuifilaceae bacterium]|jgi:DNA repair protein RadC|uniref:RadC family protein n=1 Tax=Perlabentimonas gracilis TaxID=2715279 RepID=UPI0014095613|nr:DNA repair protein RadC [Perlabentimonas gracilis]MDX9769014.1 DNA repair protein RadC [Tenuifilaceae bacterium]NHB67924.1 JAB domain-containing protein [Perlabentimonas gracilis]